MQAIQFEAESILFIFLGSGVVVTTLGMLMARNPATSAMVLVLNFLCLAGMYLFLNAPFLASVQVIVYAGAIMVLFLFTIMLLNSKSLPKRRFGAMHVVGICVGILFLVQVGTIINSSIDKVQSVNEKSNINEIKVLSTALFNGPYLFAFEVASLLLFVAIIGAIVVTKKHV